MAVDIILYDVDYVPVGKDQKQHVEYARDITTKFNQQFGEVFKLPEAYIQEDLGVIPGLDGRKMSKSYNNYIWLLDAKDDLVKKIKKIPTDAIAPNTPKDPDGDNLYEIYKIFLNKEENENLRQRFKEGSWSYKTLKEELIERVLAFIDPIQKKFYDISDEEIEDLLKKNAIKANEIAEEKKTTVYKIIWLS